MADIEPAHTLLYCKTRSCHRAMVVLPGAWCVVRELRAGENARAGHGAVFCVRCESKWEYTQAQQEQAA